jgi:hypothetical protein
VLAGRHAGRTGVRVSLPAAKAARDETHIGLLGVASAMAVRRLYVTSFPTLMLRVLINSE